MLLPLLRAHDRGLREPSLVRWSAVTSELREDLEREPGQPPARLLAYLEGIDPAHQQEAIQDLIAEHLRFCWRRGTPVLLEQYEGLVAGTLPAELIEDEYLARHALPGGDGPLIAEYERRFPERPEVAARLRRRSLGACYVKLRRLGRGASGEVWEARDLDEDRLVAVKELRAEWRARSEARDCLVQEAQLNARLDHPGIVKVFELVQEEDAAPYLVMALVSGRPLAELIRDYHYPRVCRTRHEKRRLWNELLTTFETVCAATAHAHGRGVLHRDLKADDVLVAADGSAVILDWGLATRARDLAPTQFASAVGTPECMAPEQVHGLADERSDVFALGAILHELLTGCPVRDWAGGRRPADWRRIVLEQRPIPARRLNPSLPRELSAICSAALAWNASERTQSAEALLQALRQHRARAVPPSAGGALRRLLSHAHLPWRGPEPAQSAPLSPPPADQLRPASSRERVPPHRSPYRGASSSKPKGS